MVETVEIQHKVNCDLINCLPSINYAIICIL